MNKVTYENVRINVTNEVVHVRVYNLRADFSDSVLVWQRFLEAINRLSGVTVLGTLKHDFPGGGFSGVAIIGESHAAIHTWPETNYAFAELATCGDPLALDELEQQFIMLRWL
jgi:S-adenosylmethionine/arginine decarboxylase-like enzyme